MAEPIAEWLEGQADRSFDRQRARVETCKLLATFIAGIALTMVATALQVGDPTGLDVAATIAAAVCLLLTGLVVRADRLTEVDHKDILQRSVSLSWTPDQTLRELRAGTIAGVKANEQVVKGVEIRLLYQALIAVLTATLAATSLLLPLLKAYGAVLWHLWSG